MDIEGGKSYNKHKLKVYAYIKAKRLIRKQNKTFSNREAGAAMAMSMARGGNDADEEEMERIREEREDRMEKNRAWRLRKERERRRMRGEVSDDESSTTASTATLTSPIIPELRNQMLCTSCQDSLTGKVWQCQVGHPVCRNCVDRSWLQEEDDVSSTISSTSSLRKSSSSSLDRFSNLSDNSVKEMIEKMSEKELLDLLEVSSTTSSNVTFSGPTLAERNIKEINWFKNSLNIRKDAITAYQDYHNEGGSIFPTFDQEDENEADEVDNWDVIPKDEVELRHDTILKKAQDLKLQESEADQDSGNETQSDSTHVTFSGTEAKVVNPIDWFAGTIEVKKDVITPYLDYHEEQEELDGLKGVTFKKDVDYIEDCGWDDESLDSASVLEKSIRIRQRRSNVCQSCESPIIGRNFFIENIARTIFQS